MNLLLYRFCEKVNCSQYRAWTYQSEFPAVSFTYSSTIDCAACRLIDANAEYISHVPDDCLHLAEINKFVDNEEKQKVWDTITA